MAKLAGRQIWCVLWPTADQAHNRGVGMPDERGDKKGQFHSPEGHFMPKVRCIKWPDRLIDKSFYLYLEDKAVLLTSKPFDAVEMPQGVRKLVRRRIFMLTFPLKVI